MERRYIVEIMADIVLQVQSKLLSTLQAYEPTIEAVNYLFGHPVEILETLRQMSEAPTLEFKRYPLVALFTDIEEHKGRKGIYSTAELTLLVVHHTQPEYKAAERLVKNFKPVIHPVVDALLDGIADSPYFMELEKEMIERTETDQYYIGRQGTAGGEANTTNDYLDGTRIVANLTVNPSCILKPLITNIS